MKVTQMLIKEQRLSMLPPRDIPIFSGNPLQYLNFIHTFEYGIEDKIDSSRDRLFFLEPFTVGLPQELVHGALKVLR